MSRFSTLACVAIALATSGLPNEAHAAESYNSCTGFITALPTVVHTQGTWCLKQDLSTAITSGVAIATGATNNVTIDCNHFKIGGLAGGAGTLAFGIHASGQNITVRNCSVRGFHTGIVLLSIGNSTVELNRLDGNTVRGIVVAGDGSQVRNNHVADTGGSTQSGPAYGIWFQQGAITVENNRVSGVIPGGGNDFAYGIFQHADGTKGSVVRGNHVTGVIPTGFGTGFGISGPAFAGSGSVFEANTVINPPAAAAGISAGPDNLCVGNRLGGFGQNSITAGCVNGGGNLVF
jgi:parallel beta-helix repeat protein